MNLVQIKRSRVIVKIKQKTINIVQVMKIVHILKVVQVVKIAHGLKVVEVIEIAHVFENCAGQKNLLRP